MGRRSIPDLAAIARNLPGRPHHALSGRLFSDPLRGYPRCRLRSRAVLIPTGGDPGGRLPGQFAAHHIRSAGTSADADGADPAFHAAGRGKARAANEDPLQRADRPHHRTTPLRCRGRLRPAHSCPAHCPYARDSRRTRRPVPHLDQDGFAGRDYQPGRAEAGRGGDLRVFRRADHETARRWARRRPCQLSHQGAPS